MDGWMDEVEPGKDEVEAGRDDGEQLLEVWGEGRLEEVDGSRSAVYTR